MANVIPPRPRHFAFQRRSTFAVIAGQYNPTYVQGLVENFKHELEAIAPNVSVDVYEVPGSFEIPIVAQELATRGGIDAIIAFGVVLQGATLHAELIGHAVTDALMDCSMRFRIPVIHEVLVVRDEEQAKERCLDPELNRGIEAARAAVRIVHVLGELKPR